MNKIKQEAKKANPIEPNSIKQELIAKHQTRSFHEIHRTRWNKSNIIWLVIVTFFSFLSRFYYIQHPDEIVWDEFHFAKFASYYIKREYFFDVHPPLAKLIFAFVGWIFNYEGHFIFEAIGKQYDENIPFVAMRSVSALCGSLTIVVSYCMLIELDFSLLVALLATSMLLLDNGLLIQSKYILLDAQLMFFIIGSCFCWIKFSQYRYQSFSSVWWSWLTSTGFFLGFVLSVKFVGLFVYGLIGIMTLIDLWNLMDYKIGINIKGLIKHWCARILCLIIFPAILFTLSYFIHFKVLYKSGTGDKYMSSEFQMALDGNLMNQPAEYVFYGGKVTIKSTIDANYLHSHPDKIPLQHSDGRVSSNGQQVTGYPFEDQNNDWIIYPPLNTSLNYTTENIQIQDGEIVRLKHIKTNKFLITHNVASPLTKHLQEVACFEINSENDPYYEKSLWRIKVTKGESKLFSKASYFRLEHLLTSCNLNNFQKSLPSWGYAQAEINSGNLENPSTMWMIEKANPPSGNFKNQENAKKPLLMNELIRKPSFLTKFSELIFYSIDYNNKIVVDDPLLPSPFEWPFVKKGINFWGSKNKEGKLFLVGNPLAWYMAFLSVPLFITLILIDKILKQRGYEIFDEKDCKFLYQKGGFFLLGYFFHYLPFFLMGRALYLHHYLPAYIFSVLVCASYYEILSNKIKFLKGKIFVSALCIALLSVFIKIAPLSYGFLVGEDYLKSLKWFPGWNFI